VKILLDFVPLLLFFGAFRLAGSHADEAAALGTQWFGFLVRGGTVTPEIAPVLWATVVAVVATLVQVLVMLVLRRRVGAPLWIGLVVIVVMGGLTLGLNSEAFIKWKPTLLYGTFATLLAGGQLVARKNLLRSLLGEQLSLPLPVWAKLLWSWVGFFVFAALLNVYVAQTYETAVWVNFKVFGLMALTLVFTLAQGIYMARHMQQPTDTATGQASPSETTRT
jgi:intracellular septation protein